MAYAITKDKPFSAFTTYDSSIGSDVNGWATYSTYDLAEGETLNYNKLMEV